jgi:(1->4)-alpha-D-glucan 1-alpha-D-glucosylmutase
MTDAFERLAGLAGIQAQYHDIRGQPQRASRNAIAAVVTAMGLPCSDDAEAAASLRDWQAAEWRRPLPPVLVSTLGRAPITVTLRLPVHDLGRSGHWRLTLEDGGERTGPLHPDRLPVQERARVDGRDQVALALAIPAPEVTGYHRLGVALNGLAEAAMDLIVCPSACYRPPALLDDKRAWGIASQLYGLRSERNWGMGDFSDLRHLVEWAAEHGAGLVGINPLHALRPDDPNRCSPYSPSSRQFLNPLYLDIEAVPEYDECAAARAAVAAPEFQARLRALRAEPLVDYAGVAELKLRVLAMLHACFRDRHLAIASPRAAGFRRFQAEQGDDLRGLAAYEALQARFRAEDASVWGWPAWPAEFRDPASPAVRDWLAAHGEETEFRQYLQWLAFEQLHAVGLRSLELGLGVGLYQDLAVGVDRGGAETWLHRDLYALGAAIGSPADDCNLRGQDWGLPPPLPNRLREAAYRPFIRTLQANMREAGAIRIDHVMGLQRLYWIPPGASAPDGVYVEYPFRDLLGILALESQRNHCLVIGEDLGTVPDSVRAAMQETGILACRLLWFEKHWQGDQSFKAPDELDTEALLAATTHDLPTLAGYWRGLDLDLRTGLGLFPSEAQREAQVVGRAEDRARLLMALEREHLLPEGTSVHPVAVPEMTTPLALAIHQYLARSPARLALVQAEDMLGEAEQANLPGTLDGHPNWRRKLSLNLEAWPRDGRPARFAGIMVAERGASVQPGPAPPRACAPDNAPRATYRLQMNKDFGFADAGRILPYLADLGISHVYCSPFLRARPGSLHGYDIVDHATFNPEIGGAAEFAAFADELERLGLKLLLDIVPNHMGVMGADNARWLDLLENGQAASAADWFDVDWRPLKGVLRDRVLVPVLGDHYGTVLERGELTLTFEAGTGEFSVWYWQHRFPVDPAQYPRILGHRVAELGARLGAGHPDFLEYQSLATAFSHLPPTTATDPQRRAERARDKEIHKRHLADLAGRCPDIDYFLRENVDRFNAPAGEPAGLDLLDDLLAAQPYRLAYWRVAADEINYRRFFDVNDLAALHMEREEVFEATHRLIGDLMADGRLDALRIDHADGLYAPARYFERLQRLYRESRPSAVLPPYIVVEKILAPHERLPADWAVCGTTGYEFANLVNGLFIDAGAATAMERTWQGFSGRREAFDETLYQAKRAIMTSSLAAELNMLANRLSGIAEMDRHTRDHTLVALRMALMEVTACFPVYRTYLGDGPVTDEDRRHVEWACAVARRRARTADPGVFDFVRDVLTTAAGEGKHAAYRQAVREFALRFAQFSAPVMAKGMEDTAFYRYHRLDSVNDVGGDPRRFGVSVAAFHHANQERSRHMPHGLLATASHDSKRAEDVRCRIDVLSELPAEWHRMVHRWHRLNRSRLNGSDGEPVPCRADEYLFYQTLVGSWPLAEDADLAAYAARIRAYLVKAVREAKLVSSWINPDPDYEAGLAQFVDGVLLRGAGTRFMAEFVPFAERVAWFGRLNSLAQTLFKLTCPGVPDLYQGSELWTDSLVDPDNRRPVDYALRITALAALDRDEPGPARDIDGGGAKLYLIRTALRHRRQDHDLYARGDYQPLAAEGAGAAHLVAYARTWQDRRLVVLAPRLAYTLMEGKTALPVARPVWRDTRLALPWPVTGWRDLLSGRTLAAETSATGSALSVAATLAEWPLALLVAPPPAG